MTTTNYTQGNFTHDNPTDKYQGTLHNGWDVYTNQHNDVILRYGDHPTEYKALPMQIALAACNFDPDYDEAIRLINDNVSSRET